MKQISRLLLVLLALGSISIAHAADSAPTAAATVNGKPIKQSVIDYIIKDATARGQKIDDGAKDVVLNRLVSTELVVQEAQRLGLDKQADYLIKEDLAKRDLLVNTFLQDYMKKNPVSDADSKAAYDKYRNELGDKEYSAKHILVATEAEAKDIIAQLGKGGDFAKIAKEKSKDPGSKDKGGDLGWFSPAGMVKPFSEAVTKMQKGSVSQTPIQTQFGWHVIKLEDTRDLQAPPYEKVKDGLQKQLQQQQLEKLMIELRTKAKIVDYTKK